MISWAEVSGRSWGGGGLDGEAVEKLRSAIQAGEPATVEMQTRRADRSEFWNRVSVAPVTDSSGTVTHVVGFQTDITKERAHKRELVRFKQAVEVAGHAIYLTDAAGEIFYVNSAFERITGFSESEAVGENPRILQSGEMPKGYYEQLWDTVTDGEVWEEEVINRRKSGELYHAEQTIAPITGPEGKIVAYVAIQTDITERKRTEKALRQYKQTVESSKDLLAAIDDEWEYLLANETYRKYHGIEDEVVTGRSLREVVGAEQYETIRPKVRSAFEGELVQTEVTRTHPEQGDRILGVRLFPLQDADGTVQGVGASMRDITADRELEAAIERESELWRVMSEANHTLVHQTGIEGIVTNVTDIEGIVTSITDIVASSSMFECTFTYLLETTRTNVVCERGSELTARDVRDFHGQEYVDAVFEAGVLQIEDVTEPPFEQHEEPKPSHRGLGIAITHEGVRYGILTVHFSPGVVPSLDAIELLERIGDDLGYYIKNQFLRSEHKFFTDLVERIEDPVMLQNRDGTYRVINDAVTELSGIEKTELIGSDETAFMDEAAARTVREMQERVLETETAASSKLTATFPDGRELTFSTVRYPYYDDGRLDGTVAVWRDITDLEKHQQQLRVLDRVLRHNVNNNMTVVQGYAEMIEEQASDEVSQYATKIAGNGAQLLDIAQKQRKITDVLSDPGTIERLDLVPIVEHLVERLQSAYPDADISVSMPAEVEVRATESIEVALEELLVNCIVHSDLPKPNPTVRIEKGESTVQIRVLDENQPISELDRTVLTGETELDTLRHGSGLGLWLVKLVVGHSGGTVTYAENDPRGNIVTIELPKE